MAIPLGEIYREKFALVSGRTNPELVKSIASHLQTEPVFFNTKNWGNGYPRCTRDESVSFAGKKVIIVSSLQYKGIGSPIEELELMFDACGSADEIHLILTWLCAKDDITHGYGHTPTAAWIAHRIVNLNPKTVSWFDPHQSSHTEFFYPIGRRKRFYLLRLLIELARDLGIDQIGSTDASSTKRAKRVESFLKTGLPILNAEKEHEHQKEGSPILNLAINGTIIGKKIGLFDDMTLSWNTMQRVVRELYEKMAKQGVQSEVHTFAVHFDPTEETYGNIAEALDKGWIQSFSTTNSNPIDVRFRELRGFTVVDASKTVARLVEMLVMDKSTFDLFDDI